MGDELNHIYYGRCFGSLLGMVFEEISNFETEDKFSTVVESIRGSRDVPDFFKHHSLTFNPWNEALGLKRVFFERD